jgi:hypothetical protein
MLIALENKYSNIPDVAEHLEFKTVSGVQQNPRKLDVPPGILSLPRDFTQNALKSISHITE